MADYFEWYLKRKKLFYDKKRVFITKITGEKGNHKVHLNNGVKIIIKEKKHD